MKAVIVDIKHGSVVALNDEGCMVKVKNNNYQIGQVIELKKRTNSRFIKTVSAAVVLLILGIGAWSFLSPYTYVSLDVNPSIQYSVNRFGLVLSAEAVNGDGAEILEDLDLTMMNIEDAVSETVEGIVRAGYFDGDEPGGIMLATSCQNEAEAIQLRDQLQIRLQDAVQDREGVDVEAVAVGLERVEEAQELGITPGKLNLIEKMIASSDDPDSISIEDLMDMSVKDIQKAIKDNKKEDKPVPPGQLKKEDNVNSENNDTEGVKQGDTENGNGEENGGKNGTE